MRNRLLSFAILALLFGSASAGAAPEDKAPQEMTSPDGRLVLSWQLENKSLRYQVERKGKPFIGPSQTGLRWQKAPPEWKDLTATITSNQSSWKPVWGKRTSITSHYQQAEIALTPESTQEPQLTVIFRLFDDGIALRYRLEKNAEGPAPQQVLADLTEFNFAQEGVAWSYNGERENKGPEKFSAITGTRRLPLTISFSQNCYASVAEAHLDNFGWMNLQATKAPSSFQAQIEKTKVTPPFETPWRTILVGDSLGNLVDSSLLENLNPPCAIEDPSWIKPGLTLWDWRTWGYTTPDGFQYGLDMASWKRFIDFAQRHEIPHPLLDANWYGPEFDPKMDPTKSRDHLLKQVKGGKIVRQPPPADWEDPIDVPALIKYGQERRVGIFLYINDKARVNYNFEGTLATYQEWGAVGIKYGFMGARNRQHKVNKTNEIIQLCAKHKLMCNFHDGPIPPNGDYRTWPNCTTREYCHAQTDAKRSFTPTTFNSSVFVNMITGPIDMNNGMFALTNVEKTRPRVFKPIPSTIVGECARTLLTFSGQTIVLDAPEPYEQHPLLLNFLTAQKQPWQESVTLDGQIGEYLVMRRTAADGTILLGATTNEDAREVTVPLDFLGEEQVRAIIMQDAAGTTFEKNREDYTTDERMVSQGDKLTLQLGPGGGACVLFETAQSEK